MSLLADNKDPAAGDFSNSCEQVAAYIPTNSYTIHRNYLAEHTPPVDPVALATVRSNLLESFNSGSYLIFYFGHGNADILADEGFLKLAASAAGEIDIDSLTNALTAPVFCAMTCAFADFGAPGTERLGEGLVARAHGGASALWGSVSETYNFASQALAEHLAESIFEQQTIRLGDAILESCTQYETSGMLPYVLDVTCLLGDPAQAMASPGFSFGSWQSLVFTPEQIADPQISGPLADPDGDGIVNLVEFSNNGNPTNAAPIAEFEAWMERVDAGGGQTNDYANASFRQRIVREGIETFIESCTNLLSQTWTSGPGTTTPSSIIPVDDLLEEVVVRVHPELTTNRQTFIRLKVRLTD